MEHQQKAKEIVLLFSTFLIAISGLVYELLAGTVSSYFLGDSIFHFSLVIGLFMSSMGIGSWLSRFVEKELLKVFIVLQLFIAVIGGFSAVVLFYAFAVIENYTSFLYLSTILIGAMLGVEIPLIIRILKDYFSLKTNVSNVFTMDYIGALIAALLFPMVFLPKLGLLQTSLFFGALNTFVALMTWYLFRQELPKRVLGYIVGVIALLGVGSVSLGSYSAFIEHRLYQDEIIYSETSPYQNMVLTRNGERYRLYINGALQFDTLDEYRYHEALVHPAMISTKSHENILIIGGGDAMALREVLKYDDVKAVTLVDLDAKITELFSNNILVQRLNDNAFNDERVKVHNVDAWKFLEHAKTLYDVIIIDLPDPNNISLSRLYSKSFYTLVKNHLSFAGAMVCQSTSPLYARQAFYSIVNTVRSTGMEVLAYHVYVPSFGEWGFTLAMNHTIEMNANKLPKNLKYLDETQLDNMTIFAPDMQEINASVNTLMHHSLMHYYNEGWSYWYE
ncbi:MAG: polyamine aminopropyltransferase [Campylobacterota bacterium]|nr:polyamine aminopropyltransferase [Campylobacterota bacterium]